MGRSIAEGAAGLARLGFAVFPVKGEVNNAGKWVKKPLTPRGFKDATTDPATAYSLFWGIRAYTLLIGMRHDGMTIVDADGQQGVDTLNMALPILPEPSVVVRTISGGIHYYIAGTEGIGKRKPRLAAGLDILTGDDEGFVVVPPSPGYEIIMGSFEQLAGDMANGLAEQAKDSEGSRSHSDGL